MTVSARPCQACPGGSTGREARRAAPPACWGRVAARRAPRPVDYLDKPVRRACQSRVRAGWRSGGWCPVRPACVAATEPRDGPLGMGHDGAREGTAATAKPIRPRGDAGVEVLSEMTIGRTDDPGNPQLATAGQPGRVIVWAGSRNPSGPAAMLPRHQAGHMTAVDPPVSFASTLLLHPRGRPHMRVAYRPGQPTRGWMKLKRAARSRVMAGTSRPCENPQTLLK
jgi:hypothetical protein